MIVRLVAVLVPCVLACSAPAFAADPVLPHPEEQAAWSKIAARFSGEPTVKLDRMGRLQQIEVKGFKLDKPETGWARVTLDPAAGRVIEISSDRAGFTNDEFQLFQPFTHLKKLTLWHNSNFHSKEADIEDYDATGLKFLRELPQLEAVTLAGGAFDDDGMREAARLPQLKYLGMWHVRVSDAGMSAFREHPTLEEIRLGPFWGKLMTDETVSALSTCPKLRSLSIGETWLTYEGGLKHLTKLNGTLKKLDLQNALIEPGDVEKLKADLPEVDVNWGGLESAGKVLTESGWHRGKAEKWMPADLVERALAAAK